MHILFEDQEILVVEKPSGVPVETRKLGTPDMVSLLKNYLVLQKPGSPPYLGVVHRLDQPVQGVMVFAKTPGAASSLSAQLQKGAMKKIYLAVVSGIVAQEQGELEDYLLKDGKTNTSRVVSKETKGAKKSLLSYQRLETLPQENLSLVKIYLLTGRHHQIRVQMAHAGHPLSGDRKYNPQSLPGENTALLAYQLSFCHPVSKRPLSFTCQPLDPVFKKFNKIDNLS